MLEKIIFEYSNSHRMTLRKVFFPRRKTIFCYIERVETDRNARPQKGKRVDESHL